MLENANVTITGTRCKLVPYREEHVSLYHSWMQNADLQEATASEPLTLEAEFDMQKTWAKDADKLTFIILDLSLPDSPATGAHGGGMAGDVNLFFNDQDDPLAAEVEIMVAEPLSRRHGIGAEAVRLMAAYAHSKLGTRRVSAKIGEANAASLAMFTGRLGFSEIGRSAVFQEVHLQLELEGQAGQALLQAAGQLGLGSYDAQG